MAKKKKTAKKSAPRKRAKARGKAKATSKLAALVRYYTKGLAPYAIALQKAGLLSGESGHQTLAPEVKELVEALHTVLAGGSEATRSSLDGALANAIRATNVITRGRVDVFYG